MNNKQIVYTCLLGVFFLMTACQKDDEGIIYEEGSNEYVNQWMKEQMQRYYYWNDAIPDQVDLSLDPKTYFGELLHPQDPFSYAYHPLLAESFPQSLPKTYGFEMGFHQYGESLFGVILYTLPGSPAANLGLERGLLIQKINGNPLDLSNYRNSYEELILSEQAELQLMSYSEESGFSSTQSVSLSSSFSYNASIEHQVLAVEDKKIGYLYIPHFDVGLSTPLLQVFSDFKNQGISDLVIDLRYNGGGDVSSATALSIILAPHISKDDPFIKFVGNKNGGTILQSFEEALLMNAPQVSFENLRNVRPAINRVYLLCGNHTASASEIILNNLKPYMQVISLGDLSLGKDVAGFPVKDERKPEEQGWVIFPSIYKLFNANDQGNYSQGITPDYLLDELESMDIKALGHPDEALLAKALQLISGESAQKPASRKNSSSKLYVPITAEPVVVKKIRKENP